MSFELSGTEKLEKAFDSLDADIRDLLTRYRTTKAQLKELLEAAKGVLLLGVWVKLDANERAHFDRLHAAIRDIEGASE